jgi:pSer/pThr/pTyr-binding forkhead associated (FHA) protein
MTQTLVYYYARFLKSPREVEGSLVAPLLLFDLPGTSKEPTDTENRYRYKTASGVAGAAFEPGEPIVFMLGKTKDNAFQRGVTVGRTANNDLVLDDVSVSRFHAWFQRENSTGEWSLVDAGSKNGTLVGGQRLTLKKPFPLIQESSIRFGQVDVRFLLPSEFILLLKSRT